jgi:hypothetical protein
MPGEAQGLHRESELCAGTPAALSTAGAARQPPERHQHHRPAWVRALAGSAVKSTASGARALPALPVPPPEAPTPTPLAAQPEVGTAPPPRLYHELAKVVQSVYKIFELLYLKNFVDS